MSILDTSVPKVTDFQHTVSNVLTVSGKCYD